MILALDTSVLLAIFQADQLAAVDRGYLRGYFPDLPLLGPPAS